MSVAFRRENDDEHLEPTFELPIPAGPNYVTPRGLKMITETLARLAEQLATLSDEAAIKALQRERRYWNTRQSTAQAQPAPPPDQIAFGSTFTCLLNHKERSFTLVGDDEADAAAGLVSWTSPIGRAVMRAEPGDLIDFGGQKDAIEILSINASADDDALISTR